jgi:transcriptional regulator with XRE-family HTH domain
MFHAAYYQDAVCECQQPSVCVFYQNPDMETLASRLKNSREAMGLTQEGLAAKAKIRQSFIGALEVEAQRTSKYLPEIAEALGVSVLWLKSGRSEKAAPSQNEKVIDFPPVPFPPLVQEVIELALSMSDRGKIELIGRAKELAVQHPLHKANPAKFLPSRKAAPKRG